MSGGANAPVIIKKKKVSGGDGHHGGAWKVAYADFVTAMMAFFMLMWLLNATTEQQRKGIADYFSPTIAVSRVSGGGDGMFGGDDIMSDGSLAQRQEGSDVRVPIQGTFFGSEEQAAEVAALEEVEEILLGVGGESLLQHDALRHVVTRLTDEGLVIEVFAQEGVPLFRGDSAEPADVLKDLLPAFAEAFGIVSNRVAIDAHMRQRPLVARDSDPWAITTARADEVRRMFLQSGLDEERLARITGHGHQSLADRNGLSVRNDRIVITLLREDRDDR